MNLERTRALLDRVAGGEIDSGEALRQLSLPDTESLSFATIDHHRALRQGFPEVVFAAGKTVDQMLTIASHLNRDGEGFLITRVQPEMWGPLSDEFPTAELNQLGRVAYLAPQSPPAVEKGTVLVITAGTSDLPVAEEAAVCARAFGARVERLTDVGVAGIHRLLSRGEQLQSAGVIIVVAGMEGALPSVVGGLVAVPVIAVPTSVGYGASFGGIAALLSMLNSCAAGVTVVNIDNGFGAAYAASRIIHR
ncbi:MAG: nickel pincer cofactor biosynthesis protein LarB [Gemmatimonadota bacterium]|nr:nickel pincer cofactor biosynthesis protein LarB [Gemmatimonadota bacterium]